jgi:CRP-like cAMP-binding protein
MTQQGVQLNWAQFPATVHEQGHVLFLENDPGGSLYVIQSGQIEVYRNRAGREVALASLGPGEILGAMTLVNRGARTASARCSTAVTIIHIPKEATQALVAKLPDWIHAILSDLVKRVEQADSLYIRSALAPTQTRLMGPILQLSTQLADGFKPMAEMLSELRGEASVPLQQTLKMLARVMSRPDTELQRIFSIFEQKGLVRFVAQENGQKAYHLESFVDLGFYANYVRDHFSNDLLGELMAAYTPSFRDILYALVDCGFKVADRDRQVRISLAALNAKLNVSANLEMTAQQSRQFEYFGLLDLEKTSEDLQIRFNDKVLRTKAACMDVVQMLDQLEAAPHRLEQRRTLVY